MARSYRPSFRFARASQPSDSRAEGFGVLEALLCGELADPRKSAIAWLASAST